MGEHEIAKAMLDTVAEIAALAEQPCRKRADAARAGAGGRAGG